MDKEKSDVTMPKGSSLMCVIFPPQIKYLQDFASKLQLNIEYETEIIDVSRVVAGFLLTDNRNNVHQCRVLIVRYIHVQLSSTYHNFYDQHFFAYLIMA